jgi:hypothetical protein
MWYWRFGFTAHIQFHTRNKLMVHAVWKEIIDEVGETTLVPAACLRNRIMVGGVLLLTGACEAVAVRCMRRDALWELIRCTRVSYYPCLTTGIRFSFKIHFYRFLHCSSVSVSIVMLIRPVHCNQLLVLFCLVENRNCVLYCIVLYCTVLNVIVKYLETKINLNYV